jgi:hypothetical protein
VSVPVWLLDIFAAVMLLVATVSAARLVLARRADRDADIDVSHLLMGMAMAGTLVASLSTLPALAWKIVCAALTVWFAYRVTREYQPARGLRALTSDHHAPHLLHSAAMLYMFLALRPATGQSTPAMAGMSAAGQSLRLPTLALLFAFLLCAYVVADLNRLPAPRLNPAPRLSPATPAPAPALALALATTAAPAPPAPIAPALTGGLSPAVARGCRIAMGVTMAFMLIIML